MSTLEVSTQVPDEPKTVNDLPRSSVPLFLTGRLSADIFTDPATALHTPEVIPETLSDDEIIGQAVGYFRTAARLGRTVMLLRYHGAKGLLLVQQRQKEEKGWMAFCKAEGFSYWTLRNAFRLVEEVDKAVAAGTFTLDDLAEYGWNKALRKFGIKSAKGSEETPALTGEAEIEEPDGDSSQPPVAADAGPSSEKPKSQRSSGNARKRGNRQGQHEVQTTTNQTTDGRNGIEAHQEKGQEDESEQAGSHEQPDLGSLGTLTIGPGAVARAESEIFPSVSAVDRERKLLVCGRWDRRAKEAAARGIAVLVLPELQEARS